jgi:tight adherence protein C
MTVILATMAVLLLAVSGWLVARVAGWQRVRIDANLRQLDSYGFEDESQAAPVGRRTVDAGLAKLAERLGRAAMERMPGIASLKRGDLSAAGLYELTPEIAHGYRILLTASLLSMVVLVVVLGGGVSVLTLVLLVAAALIGGWVAPALIVRQRGRQRLDEIDRELPDLIDLLVATVEAGLGFAGSLRLVANRFQGALGQELRLTQQQQNLGISNESALNDMVERASTHSMRSFVRTVIRAESLGVSIGQIMRNLATEMRQRRRQTVREKVQKAPIKLLFPLLFLVFPALLIVILYPAMYTISHSLGGG